MSLNVPRMHIKKPIQSPCKDCADRKRMCHASCEKYKSFKDAQTEDWNKRLECYGRAQGVANYTFGEIRKNKVR